MKIPYLSVHCPFCGKMHRFTYNEGKEGNADKMCECKAAIRVEVNTRGFAWVKIGRPLWEHKKPHLHIVR